MSHTTPCPSPSANVDLEDLRPPRRDAFFDWFSELEALGECTRFRLGRYEAAMHEPTWCSLPHHSYDGLGGLYHVLSRDHATELDLPVLASACPPARLRWLAALRGALRRPVNLLQWQPLAAPAPGVPRGTAAEPPKCAAWITFSKRDTLQLRQCARARGVSFNAWLLWGLTRAIVPYWVAGSGAVEWVVPVNMRGAQPNLPKTANQAATIDVVFEVDAAPEEVDAAIRAQLASHAHWGVWQSLRVLERVGSSWIRRLARAEAGVEKHGSFSNLGNLRSNSTRAAGSPAEWWMVFNPVLRSRPVGAACLTYEDRLAVTLQLHPVLSSEPALAQARLCAWMNAVFR